jgi:hypothetical protein
MWKAFLSLSTVHASERTHDSRVMPNMIKHSHIPDLKIMSELRNTTNISNGGMLSAFPLIFFDMTQFTW